MLPWRQLPEAEAELTEAAEWYELRDEGVGYELMAAARDAIESVLDPGFRLGFYRNRRSDPQVYARSINGFPFRLIYLVEDAEIVVVAFAHERRKPGYWMARIHR